MNYEETVQYLYARLPMFSRTGAKAIKPDLGNTLALLAHLHHPERKVKTIHIAGTNGKGSVSHMLSAVFQQHGYKTGLYTSPHLRDFRERIKINGNMVSQAFVVDFVEKNRKFSETIKPSFFELTFALAMDYFASESVDIAIIETGLGGRLDSTNVIRPELSVITNIGYDHMDVLGDTLEKIAGEKAGIIKKYIPVVVGETLADTKPVFISRAKEMKAPIVFADQNYIVLTSEQAGNLFSLQVKDAMSGAIENYQLDLTADYQLKNLVTVLPAIHILREKWYLKGGSIKAALSNVRQLTGFEGRWQILRKNPMVILDVAHNADGIRQIMQQLSEMPLERLHIITGMVKDKDSDGVLKLLPQDARYYFTNAHIPRALPADQLCADAARYGLKGTAFDDVNDAILSAITNASADDVILICGSVFVVGEVDLQRISGQRPKN